MDWNRTPIEPVAPHDLIPVAQVKNRPTKKRLWEQQPENVVRRYRLPENLYGKICAIATQNNISNISHAAIQLVDYALYQRSLGNQSFQPVTRPNPQGRKFRVAWKAGQTSWNNTQGKLSPDFERGKQKHKEKTLPGEYGGKIKDVGLRLGAARLRLKDLADETCLPISDTLTFLLLKAVLAYENGEISLELKQIPTPTD